MAEKDTAAAAQAALGPPESRRWPPKGRPSAAAGRRGSAAPAKNLKSIFGSRMVNWTTLGVSLRLLGNSALRVFVRKKKGIS